MKITKERVDQWVLEQTPSLLEDLIAITNIRSVAEIQAPQVPPFGQGCRDVLEKMLAIGRDCGFATRNYEYYVGSIALNDLPEEIGIWSHLDVVEEGEGWMYPPYDARVENGHVIGRGCQDNKSSAIVGLYAMKFLKEFQIPVRYNVKLYLGTCEEKGMYDLDYFIEHYPCPKLSLVPDSGFPICIGERGTFNGEICYRTPFSEDVLDLRTPLSSYMLPGEAVIVLRKTEEMLAKVAKLPETIQVEIGETITCSAHGEAINAGNPFSEGNQANALQTLLVALHEQDVLCKEDDELLSLCRELNRDYDGAALGIACQDEASGPLVLACNSAVLENHCLKLNCLSRYPISKNEVEFEKIVAEVCAENGAEFHTIRLSKACIFDPDNPVVDTLTSVYNDYMQLETKPFVMSGGTYAEKLPRAYAFGTGMPLPIRRADYFPPGHGDYHQPDESIPVARIQKALAIYILGLLEIA